ncbi:unnamed protein product [Phytophthora fragariaefolia]|uniref:Unnamed protein product n=1 Tax=Phytophthora fragariaefolia TaxID=1490495 RepID=A0A9W6XR47_9STRA|nr:unnamed protein product [Phytophthora fragariaefolia]
MPSARQMDDVSTVEGCTGAHIYEDQDIDMCDANVDRGPHHRAEPPTPEADPGVLTHDHSPASETDPSQEPFWHDASPAIAGPQLDGAVHGFPEQKVDSANESDCLVLGFYATVTNTQAKKRKLSAAKAAEADLVKQRVIDIVLANLRYDVELRLISPKAELQRIYPAEHPQRSLEAAAAMLFAHYTKMRQVSVLTPDILRRPRCTTFNDGFLREPVYIWDTGASGDTYVQQNVYYGQWRHSRDRRQGHFYGVHLGETFHEWHAQRGPEMRARLDTVHAQVGLPILPSAGYEPEFVEADTTYEEQNLLGEMGVDFYGSGSQDSVATTPTTPAVRRAKVDPHSDVYRSVYGLLKNADPATRDAIDSSLVVRLTAANNTAFVRWAAGDGRRLGLSTSSTARPTWTTALDWLSGASGKRSITKNTPSSASVGTKRAMTRLVATVKGGSHFPTASTQEALEHARDRQRWSDLRQLVDVSLLRLRPLEIPLEHWFILYVIPYVISGWMDTAMGRAPTSARTVWYNEYQQVRDLCLAVADSSDWSHALRLRLGPLRADPRSRWDRQLLPHTKKIKAANPPPLKVGTRQSRLEEYFPVQGPSDRQTSICRDLRRYRRGCFSQQNERSHARAVERQGRRQHLRTDNVTICMSSHNVQGFGATPSARADCLASFKSHFPNGHFNLVLLQETHIAPQMEHVYQWGYRVGDGVSTLSYWAGDTGMAAEVGILLHLRSGILHPRPVLEDYWSPQFMAIAALLDRAPSYVFNIYAPTGVHPRESYHAQLAKIPVPYDVLLFVGGGFNCTQYDSRDRSVAPTASQHRSEAFTALLCTWHLTDSADAVLPTPDDPGQLQWFYEAYHTDTYTINGKGTDTSRLDRCVTPTRHMTLGGGGRVQEIIQRIATVKREWIRTNIQRLFQTYAWRPGQTTKRFFKRVSSKFIDNYIPALRTPDGTVAHDTQTKAETVANGRRHILQEEPTATEAIDCVCHWMEQHDGDDFKHLAMAAIITEGTVAQALRAYKPGKAFVPDRLRNDWYRDYAELLVPVLARLYRLWWTLVCRVRKFQDGFVPSRHIHSTIEYLVAARRNAHTSPAARDALAFLLDFAKAYDSLDRRLLYAVLRRHGYPTHFIQVVERLHGGTTVRFLANGASSGSAPVTRGIWQGYPLASLLFILALEPLYLRIQSGVVIKRVVLRKVAATVTIRVVGYADGTAVYLMSPAELPVALGTIDIFGSASGLNLNRHETMAFSLHPDGLSEVNIWTGENRLLGVAESCRYLGLQVGTQRIPFDCGISLRKRIRLASQHTRTIDQRSRVAAAVIIPKLLFIGRHAWPDRFETTTSSHVTCHDTDITGLPRKDGGMELLPRQAELLAMAATVVRDWARDGYRAVVGDILCPPQVTAPPGQVRITPGHRSAPIQGFSVSQTMWNAGVNMVNTAEADPQTTECHHIQQERYAAA